MMTNGLVARWALGALLSAVSCSAVALAQKTDGAARPGAEGEIAVGDIVVTAQKRAQSTKEVPAMVSVLGEEQLARAAVKDLFQAAMLMPGRTYSRARDD